MLSQWNECAKTPLTFELVEQLKHTAEQQANSDLDQALATLDRAESIAKRLDDPLAEALVWRGRATVYQQYFRHSDCLHAIHQAVAIYEQHGSPFDVAKARTVEVAVRSDLGQFEEAIALAATIRPEYERQEFAFGLARLAAALGYTYNAAWRLDESFREHEIAYRLYRELGLDLDAAWVQHNMGVLANQMDQLDLARDYYSTAYPVFTEHDDRVMMVKCQFNLAQNANRRGAYSAALEHLVLARHHLAEESESLDHGYVDLHEAQVRQRLNQPEQAEQLLHRAVARFEDQQAPLEAAETLLELGQLLGSDRNASHGRLAQGMAGLERAVALLNDVDAPLLRAWLILEQAELLLRLGRWAEAAEQATNVAAQLGVAELPLRQAQAAVIVAEADEQLRPERAAISYRQVLAIIGDAALPAAIRCWVGLGRLATARQAWGEAEISFERALSIVLLLRRTMQTHSQRAGLLEEHQAVIDGLLTALHHQPQQADAILHLLETVKAGALADLLAGQPQDLGVDASLGRLLHEREILAERLDHSIMALHRERLPPDGESMPSTRSARSQTHYHSEQQSSLRRRLQELDEAIARRQHPALAWRDGATVDADTIRQELADDALMLSYYTVADQLYLLAATNRPGDLHIIPLSISLNAISEQWQQCQRLLLRGKRIDRRLQQRLARLYDALIAPALQWTGFNMGRGESVATAYRRLVIVPHRELARIPFAALFDERAGRYLVERCTLQLAPSITVLQLARGHLSTRLASSMQPTPLIAGYPGEENDSAFLPQVQREIELLGTLMPDAEVLYGGDVTRERLLAALPNRSLIHLAGHAFFDPTEPLASGLPLAAGRWLRADDLYLRHGQLGGATVVLSGCSTGRGKASGADLLGLPSAFLYSGAAAVVSGLWRVDDEATAELMVHFYRRLMAESLDSAVALQQAQLVLLASERFAAPYYWAPFTLTGIATHRGN